MPQLRLTGLTYYPIKSAAGTSVESWGVDQRGLWFDRRWMVTDPRGRFLTQRTSPKLALVRPEVCDDRLIIQAPGMKPLTLPLEPETGERLPVTVWDDTCEGRWLGPEPAEWFSAYLGLSCGLVHMPDTTVRPANPDYDPAGTPVSFADAFPFLLISEESLADLNGRLSQPLPMNRFRPNLVIAGADPFVEDRLTDFEIGGIRFRAVKPCDRCVITTTDQQTMERGVEPLRTLATYRRVAGKVYFGQNVVHRGSGRLSVGARLLV
jgi:uncharacterized protein